jgi:hypothetical protein
MKHMRRNVFPPHIYDDDLPSSAVHVDMPNVYTTAIELTSLKGCRARLDWGALAQHISRAEVTYTKLIHTGAYLASHKENDRDERERLVAIRKQLQPPGFDLVVRREKDIDSLIINDMWHTTVRVEQETIRTHDKLLYPFRIRHVLVSGDGGFVRAFEAIKSVYGDHAELELVVYSWERALSYKLSRAAHRFYNLEAVEGFLNYR